MSTMPPGTLETIRRACYRHLRDPDVVTGQQEEAAADGEEEDEDELPTMTTTTWDIKCPHEGCDRFFLSAWAVSTHFNASHKDLPGAAPMATAGVAVCIKCSLQRQQTSLMPAIGRCPKCNFYQGKTSKEIFYHLRGSGCLDEEAAPRQETISNFVEELLANSAPTVAHVPLASRQKLGDILAGELLAFARNPCWANAMRLAVLPQVLLRKGRGGKRRSRADEARRQEAMDLWENGEALSMWASQDGPSVRRKKIPPKRAFSKEGDDEGLSEQTAAAVVALTRQGLPGKAAKLLLSSGIAEWCDKTQSTIQALFPQANPSSIASEGSDSDPFTEEEVKLAVKAMGRGKSPGPSGLRNEHLMDLLNNNVCGPKVLEGLTAYVNAVGMGTCERSIAQVVFAGRVVPLLKPDGGIRPLVVGECLRNLVATCWLGRVLKEVEEELAPRHLGLGKSSGVANAVIRAKLWAKNLGQDFVLIKVDFKNAYNTINRRKVMDAVKVRCSEMAGWAAFGLGSTAVLGAGGQTVLCTSGVQQGDPLSPLLFSLATAEVATALDAHWNHPTMAPLMFQQWYLDDGLVMVHKSRVADMLESIEIAAGIVGLSLNRGKCELLGVGEDIGVIARAAKVKAFPNPLKWTYLGCPLASAQENHPAFKVAWENCEKLADAVKQLDCPEAQLALVRQCLGACKINHINATCPASESNTLSKKVADGLKDVFSCIIDGPVSCDVWDQATMPISQGGLGIQDPTYTNAETHYITLAALPDTFAEGWEAAHNAMVDKAAAEVGARHGMSGAETKQWLEKLRGKGIKPLPELTKKHISTRKAARLSKATPAEKRRLNSTQAPHAMTWTLGPGNTTPLSNSEFRAGVRWALGVPVQSEPTRCPCGRLADVNGEHYAACPLLDQRTRRHNQLRDAVADAAREAGMAVEVEAAPAGTRRRPGDALIHGYKDGRPTAADFAITAATDPDAADRIAQTKERAYRSMCMEAGWDFVPVVGDAYGAVRAEGAVFLGKLCKRLSEKKEKCWPTTQTMFWQTVTTCLVRRAAGAIADAWAQGITVQALGECGYEDEAEVYGGDEDMIAGQELGVILGGAGINVAQLLPQGASMGGGEMVVERDLPDFVEGE
jgi:hypothetical protein